MAEARPSTAGAEPPRGGSARDWPRRLLNELFALFIALLFLLAGALVLLDTAPGHRFIVDRIGELETASGLKIRIGRIDGSIFGKSQLQQCLGVRQQRRVPDLAQHQARLGAGRVALQQAVDRQPDRRAGQPHPLAEAQAEHQEGARSFPASTSISATFGSTGSTSAGRSAASRAAAACSGKADVRSGRALVELCGADQRRRRSHRLPPRRRARPQPFDLCARVIAPANGLVPAMIGTKRAIEPVASAARAAGRAGAGRRRSTFPAGPTARLALGVDQGRYRLQGNMGAGAVPHRASSSG